MMKKIFNNKKGITLVSLSVVIVVILILTSVLIYNVKDSLGTTNLSAMRNDIGNLRDKINEYYAVNGSIPVKLKYTNTEKINAIRNAGLISDEIDTGDFYIIDLDAIENITLNYGEDFKQITPTMTEQEASQFTDLYIVNETSQNIFYVEGIKIDNEWFYTDYNADEVDTVAINLRYFDGVKIPEGFYYKEGTKDTGLVIEDENGNEFVWVPVDNYNEFIRREGYSNGSEQSYLPNCGEADETGINDKIVETTTTQREAQEMYESVKRNGGFYIGRYEAGKDSSGNVVVQKGADIYNWVKWSKNGQMSETSETEGGAVELSRNFDSANNYTSVTSTLIYGVQWDAVMKWIEEIENQDATGTLTKYIQDSTGMGWHNYNYTNGNATHKIGVDLEGGKNKVKNIYDLAGNVWEWTMESYNTDGRVYRGGAYSKNGYQYPASDRLYAYPSLNKYDDLGFRIALYLNDEEKWSPVYDENGKYVDKNKDEAIIPKGFKVSETPGMNTIDDGLVIQDASGNEFVWVPVNNSDDFKRYAGYSDGELQDISNYTEPYESGYTTEISEYNNMRQSIRKNKGFYVARYEAGTMSTRDSNSGIEDKVVIKKNSYVYNYIGWSNSMTSDQGGAVQKSKEFAEENGYGTVTSTLIYGVQWDAIMQWIDSKYKNEDGTLTSFVADSEGKGYFNQSAPTTTGSSEAYKIKNIYDLAGNVSEWTMEAESTGNRIHRGRLL